MLFESLEQRKLMSVSLLGNSLEIRGTDAADNYSVSSTALTLKVVENGTTYTFSASSVARINALLYGGDDTFNTVQPSLLATSSTLSYASLATSLNTSVLSPLKTTTTSYVAKLLQNIHVSIPMIVDGGYGNDRITTGGGNDIVQGNAGNDTLFGGAGNDLMDGGIFGSASGASNYGIDSVYGEDGHDTLHASDWGRGYLFGGNGNDSVNGYWGNDYLDGGAGNDNMSGYRGNDSMWGGAGDDTMQGGGGTDSVSGSDGNDLLDGGTFGAGIYSDNDGADTVRGGAGNDTLHASDYGNNKLFGDDGNDSIYGYGGQDYLNGGGGIDTMNGGVNNDTIVAVDGNVFETITGGAGTDVIWGDRLLWFNDNVTDASSFENSKTIRMVSSFANGADKTLNGDNIADPTDGTNYKNFSNNPLFAPGGPSANDVDQESAADCWMLAPLGAIAQDSPWKVKGMVVDLGDGTYGVSLGSNFYRVDADLPTWNAASNDPSFAGLGQSNSLWVAIVEKAYTHHRTGANTYNSISWGDPADGMRQLNATNVGQRFFGVSSNGAPVANEVYSHWNAYQACTICTGSVPAGSPLVASHCYTVTSVTRNSAGTVTNVRVRNPWGGDNTGGNPFVDLTPAQLAACQIWVTWGTV